MEDFEAVVKAKQGGPIFVHHFQRQTVPELLGVIGESLDLSESEWIVITITRGPDG